MQHLVIRILQGKFDFEIETPYRFLHHMIKQVYYNQYRTSKKYIFQENMESTQTEFFDRVMFGGEYCTYQEDLFDSFSLRDLKNIALTLPKKQSQAIMNSLEGNAIGKSDELGYETKKANRRHAMLKLKALLGGSDE